MIFREQIRAARALLGWSQHDLAKATNLGIATIQRIEGAKGRMAGAANSLWKIERALEEAGVIFLPGNDSGGVGVRLRKEMRAV